MRDDVKQALEQMQLPYQETGVSDTLVNYMDMCGYRAYPVTVDVSGLNTIDAKMGVLASPKEETDNNGVYIFCVLENGALGLVTVIPSTVSKAPQIRKAIGDIKSALEEIPLPPLTPFDLTEITGQVLDHVITKWIVTGLHLSQAEKETFLRLYLPKFLSNVGLYYLGVADESGKPKINEEIVNVEPIQLRQYMTEQKEDKEC